MGDIIFRTDLKREPKYLYYVAFDTDGTLLIGKSELIRGGKKWKQKKEEEKKIRKEQEAKEIEELKKQIEELEKKQLEAEKIQVVSTEKTEEALQVAE